MDPITIIVTALVAGAAAGLQPTIEQAVKDAYAGLKSLIQRKYGDVNVDLLEGDPKSKSRQMVVEENLQKTDAEKDADVLRQAKELLDAIQAHAPETAAIIGVRLEDIKGASLQLEDIISSGHGVQVSRAELQGNIAIKGVRAGQGGDLSNPQ